MTQITKKLIEGDNKLPRRMKLIPLEILQSRKREQMEKILKNNSSGLYEEIGVLTQRIKNLQRKLIIY